MIKFSCRVLVAVTLLVLVGCEKEEILTPEPIPVPPPTYSYFNTSYNLTETFTSAAYTYRQFHGWHPPAEAVMLDYDNDGDLDLIECNSNYGVNEVDYIKVYDGDASGNLSLNLQLSNRYGGLKHGRKGLVGDFNNDLWPDVLLVGTGFDAPPFTGESPIMMINKSGKGFEYRTLGMVSGFFHGASSGDIDNDGDLDIVLVDGTKGAQNSYVLSNDGEGNFSKSLITQHSLFQSSNIGTYLGQAYTLELDDIDNNGYLDLAFGGHEFGEYGNPPAIAFQTPSGFLNVITVDSVDTFGIIVDVDFVDLNNDGVKETIFNRTSDAHYYNNCYLQVVDSQTGEEVTELYFNTNHNIRYGDWIVWIKVLDNLDIIANDMRTSQTWAYVDNKYTKL